MALNIQSIATNAVIDYAMGGPGAAISGAVQTTVLQGALTVDRALKVRTSPRVGTFSQRVTLQTRLPDISAALRPSVSAAVKEGAELIAEDARGRLDLGPAPIHLRDRIHVERKEAAGYNVVFGDEDAYYGHILEFGSSHAPAYPFAIPATEAQEENVVDVVRGAVRSASAAGVLKPTPF